MEGDKVHIKVWITSTNEFRARVSFDSEIKNEEVTVGGTEWKKGKLKHYHEDIAWNCKILVEDLTKKAERIGKRTCLDIRPGEVLYGFRDGNGTQFKVTEVRFLDGSEFPEIYFDIDKRTKTSIAPSHINTTCVTLAIGIEVFFDISDRDKAAKNYSDSMRRERMRERDYEFDCHPFSGYFGPRPRSNRW